MIKGSKIYFPAGLRRMFAVAATVLTMAACSTTSPLTTQTGPDPALVGALSKSQIDNARFTATTKILKSVCETNTEEACGRFAKVVINAQFTDTAVTASGNAKEQLQPVAAAESETSVAPNPAPVEVHELPPTLPPTSVANNNAPPESMPKFKTVAAANRAIKKLVKEIDTNQEGLDNTQRELVQAQKDGNESEVTWARGEIGRLQAQSTELHREYSRAEDARAALQEEAAAREANASVAEVVRLKKAVAADKTEIATLEATIDEVRSEAAVDKLKARVAEKDASMAKDTIKIAEGKANVAEMEVARLNKTVVADQKEIAAQQAEIDQLNKGYIQRFEEFAGRMRNRWFKHSSNDSVQQQVGGDTSAKTIVQTARAGSERSEDGGLPVGVVARSFSPIEKRQFIVTDNGQPVKSKAGRGISLSPDQCRDAFDTAFSDLFNRQLTNVGSLKETIGRRGVEWKMAADEVQAHLSGGRLRLTDVRQSADGVMTFKAQGTGLGREALQVNYNIADGAFTIHDHDGHTARLTAALNARRQKAGKDLYTTDQVQAKTDAVIQRAFAQALGAVLQWQDRNVVSLPLPNLPGVKAIVPASAFMDLRAA
jgi:hypothetical protein